MAVYCDLRFQRRDGALFCEESFARFAAGLRDCADELVLVGRLADGADSAFPHRVRDDVELLGLPDYPSLARPLLVARAMAGSIARLWRLLGRVDAVWLLGPHPLATVAAAMALVRRRRVALGVREDLRAYIGYRHRGAGARLAAWALERAWRLLARACPVVVVGGELAQRYRGARAVLPIAVSLVSEDDIAAHRRDYGGTLQALSVGRLDPEKNPLLLADVLGRLDARWRLTVCGAGSLRDELASRVDDRAELTGAVSRGRLGELYASAHALLHVSFTEGVPQVLFEAWAAGLPVVATDVGGVAEAAGDAAVLIPPGDAEAAASALRRVAEDEGLRRRLIEAGYERVRRHAAPAECRRIAALLGPDAAQSASATSPRHPHVAAPGSASPPHRHMWLWAVLGPEVRRVEAGDRDLAAILDASGFELGAPADAVIVDAPAAARAAVGRLDERGRLVALVGGGPERVPPGQSRLARALELLVSPLHGVAAGARAARLARALRAAGLRTRVTPTGDRSRPYGLGPGIWRRHRRAPVGAIVAASRTAAPASVLHAAIARAAAQLGAPLHVAGTTVTESGKLLTDVVDPAGRRYLVRLAGGPARPPLERSLACLAALARADPPPPVRERIAWPIADGEMSGARWVLEPRAPGGHPRGLTPQLWEQCLELLIALHAVPGDGRPAGLVAHARTIGAYADEPALERIVAAVERRLERVPPGWSHGDFWTENLLVVDGRLATVVDWDWAAPRGLPLLDLLDLAADADPGTRGLRPGPRFERALWPLARAGGDERIGRYCAETGTPADPATLEALAIAYWLDRTARDLRPFTDRPARPGWLAENVEAPLAALAEAGW